MDGLIEFEGRLFAIDLDACVRFMISNRSNEVTKSETYQLLNNEKTGKPESDLRLVTKETTESKGDCNEVVSNVKYDLLKNLLNILVTPVPDSSGQAVVIHNFNEMHFGQMLAFNTLLNSGIIIEINEDEDE